jgi:hypothetical protein
VGESLKVTVILYCRLRERSGEGGQTALRGWRGRYATPRSLLFIRECVRDTDGRRACMSRLQKHFSLPFQQSQHPPLNITLNNCWFSDLLNDQVFGEFRCWFPICEITNYSVNSGVGWEF